MQHEGNRVLPANNMLLEKLSVTGLLSFGPSGLSLPLRRLNVLIGPHGSGKSNLLEVLALFSTSKATTTVICITGTPPTGGASFSASVRGSQACQPPPGVPQSAVRLTEGKGIHFHALWREEPAAE